MSGGAIGMALYWSCNQISLQRKIRISDIPISHWAIPRDIWRIMEEEKEAEERGRMSKKAKQQLLDFKTVTGPREFTRASVLHAVANLIATNNQVSH